MVGIQEESIRQVPDGWQARVFSLPEHPRSTLFERLRQESDFWENELRVFAKKAGHRWYYVRLLEDFDRDGELIILSYHAHLEQWEPKSESPYYVKKGKNWGGARKKA